MSSNASVLVTVAEMCALEAAAVTAGTAETVLMEEAGCGLARAVHQFWPRPGHALIFAGKGHNAGDAFVLAHHLLNAGWTVECRMAWPETEWRALTKEKFDRIRQRVRTALVDSPAVPTGRPLLLIDGLLGTGTGGTLKSPVREACRSMNRLRQHLPAESLAIDLPSGMDPGTGTADPDTVVADLTAILGYPKLGLHTLQAAGYTGRLACLPLASLPEPADGDTRDHLITPDSLRPLLTGRPFTMHKGQAGRTGIIAGAQGLTGAARLAASAASAVGGGLVTLFCPRSVSDVLAAACPPEIMVRGVNSCLEVMDFPLDAIGVGPGMGPAPLPFLAALLREDPRPVVIDADALNAMAAWRVSLAGRTGGPRLLTPHPGELSRLCQAFAPGSADPAAALAASQQAVVLSKSARSKVVEIGHPARWNTTGHPSMARGGMGDVLTGILTALSSQGIAPAAAAALGSWLIGFAAEIHHRTGSGAPEDFSASRLIELTGHALTALRNPETV